MIAVQQSQTVTNLYPFLCVATLPQSGTCGRTPIASHSDTWSTPLLRAAAWLLIAVVVALSLLPPEFRPVSGAPHDAEHFAIFAFTGLIVGLGYRSYHPYQAAALIAFTGAVEIAQVWIPGRHARLEDFVVDASAACIGVAMAWLALRAARGRDR